MGHFKNFLYDGDKLVGATDNFARVIKGEITELHSTETTEETTEVGLSDEIGEIVGDAVQPEKNGYVGVTFKKGQIVPGTSITNDYKTVISKGLFGFLSPLSDVPGPFEVPLDMDATLSDHTKNMIYKIL